MYLKYFVLVLILIASKVSAIEPYTGIICDDKKKTIKLEFFFKEKGPGLTKVFKRIDGQFLEVGKIVGQKPGSFTLWEDKNAYKGIDFAWHLDKVTGLMRPVILSKSMKKMKKMPDPLSCRAESFWY